MTVHFEGGSISSYDVLVTLCVEKRRLGLVETLAAGCIRQWRNPARVFHAACDPEVSHVGNWLMPGLRDTVLRAMPLARRKFATLHQKPLKICVCVIEKAQRIRIHFAWFCSSLSCSVC